MISDVDDIDSYEAHYEVCDVDEDDLVGLLHSFNKVVDSRNSSFRFNYILILRESS